MFRFIGGRLSLISGVLLLGLLKSGDCSKITHRIDPESKPAGATGMLNCTVLSRSRAKLMWQKVEYINNVETATMISMDEDIVRKNRFVDKGLKKYEVLMKRAVQKGWTFTLIIRALTSDDAGRYRCVLMLDGLPHSKYPFQIGMLVVMLPPSMSDSDIEPIQQALEGEDAKLTCDASGVPPPVISWSRANGKAMPNGQQTIYGTELPLKNISRDDGGVYRCKADNNVRPPAMFDITLQIRSKPVAKPFRNAYGQARDKNLEIELACIISGDPKPELFWYFINNNRSMSMAPILDDHKHEVHKIRMYPGRNMKQTDQWLTLRILQLQSGDYGLYMCMGKNRFGNGTAFMTLYPTPTCQGALCEFESRLVRKPGASGSTVVRNPSLLISIIVGMTWLMTGI